MGGGCQRWLVWGNKKGKRRPKTERKKEEDRVPIVLVLGVRSAISIYSSQIRSGGALYVCLVSFCLFVCLFVCFVFCLFVCGGGGLCLFVVVVVVVFWWEGQKSDSVP